MVARILVTDDDHDITKLLATILHQHDVTIANSGYQALEIYARSMSNSKPFDLLILDLAMLDMTGFQLEEAIRATGDTRSRVVFLSAHYGTAQQQEAFQAALSRAAGVWDKPIEAASFLALVNGVLQGCPPNPSCSQTVNTQL